MDIQNQNLPPKSESQKAKFFLSKTWSRILGIAGLIIVLAIILTGALLASHTWNPSWNPFKQPSKTDKIIKDKIIKEIKERN